MEAGRTCVLAVQLHGLDTHPVLLASTQTVADRSSATEIISTKLCHLAQPIPRLALAAVVVPPLLLAQALRALDPPLQ